MKFFREYYSFKWWQIALFKIYLFVAGLIGGAYFAEYVQNYYAPLLAVFVLLAAYFTYAWFGNRI